MINALSTWGISDFLVQAGAALLAWGFLAFVSYVSAAWCFSYEFEWGNAVRLAGIIISLLVVSLALFYFFSSVWAEITTTIIVPSFICVFALHAFLLMLKECLDRRAPLHIHATRFYVTLALLYLVFLGASALVIHLKSVYLCQCLSLVLNYFIYAAVLGIFALALCNHRHSDSY